MVRFAVAGLVLLTTRVAAVDVIDDFESPGNPNGWGWTNNSGGVAIIEPAGGDPGGWLDSGAPYFSDHPNLTAVSVAGSPLQAALASGHLATVQAAIERLDTALVTGCNPVDTQPSTFSLALIDLHTSPGTTIEAHTTDGPASPGGPFSWITPAFTIASGALTTPPGWVLNAPPELAYTWSDLMRNIDGIRLFVVQPEDLTFDACWRLGADSIVVAYASADAIFADGFEAGTGR